MYFRNYGLTKTWLGKYLKSLVSQFPVPDKQHAKRAKKLIQSAQPQLYPIYGALGRRFSLKQSFLVICKILRFFVNTFTDYHKYSSLNRDKLKQPIQMELSQK